MSNRKFEIVKRLENENILVVDSKDISIGFNPNNIFYIDENELYYPEISITGEFGNIYSENGALIKDGKVFIFLTKDGIDKDDVIISLQNNMQIIQTGKNYKSIIKK